MGSAESKKRRRNTTKTLNEGNRSIHHDDMQSILILGACRSGKSTLFKQCKFIFGKQPYNSQELAKIARRIQTLILDCTNYVINMLEGLRTNNVIDWHSAEQFVHANNLKLYVHKTISKRMNQIKILISYFTANQLPLPLTDIICNYFGCIFYLNDKNISSVKKLINLHAKNHSSFGLLRDKIPTLWKQNEFQLLFDLRAYLNIPDSMAYFVNEIDRIMRADYIPNKTDILLMDKRGAGSIDVHRKWLSFFFEINDRNYEIIDVIGQRGMRDVWKWVFYRRYLRQMVIGNKTMEVTKSPNFIMFVASLNCYDESMFEYSPGNAMEDQIECFKMVCSNRLYNQLPMVLVFTKKDLFKHKLKSIPINISSCLQDFNGDLSDFEQCQQYIQSKFVEYLGNSNNKIVATYIVDATDSQEICKMFQQICGKFVNITT